MSLTLPTLTIPAPWWLTSNGRYHYMDKARRTRCIRDAAALTYTGHRAPGNGVVWQQGAAAIRHLLALIDQEVEA